MKENLRNVILIVIFFTFVLQWKQRFHGSGSLMSLQEAERNHHLITLFLGGGGAAQLVSDNELLSVYINEKFFSNCLIVF